ncbi:PREDICTED: putative receptor-like protein kinase At4g00960 isoform X1 [Prunus mume]|uniref:Receptor-like protein kinase At4g00960 isoform X1 n=1 Tax=Prunus mume TaxID=102107 RepID=A0ABM1LMB1_PRUMU|nr:PREDICTED: putative receptor-like protein kinase At4g00960 isoform X1 [Prunus mume]
MGSSRSMLVFINLAIIILNLVAPTISQDDGPCTPTADYCWKCSDTGTYTAGDKYEENLNSLLYSFSSNTQNNSGFYSSSRGQDSNKINAIALCRGDLSLDSCRACLNKSTDILLQNCSTHKEAIIWAEPCMVRYSNKLIFGIEQTNPFKHLPSPNYPRNPKQFEPVLTHLLGNLSDTAASRNSLQKFAAGHATVPGGEPIYALAQCTPDIDKQNCSSCLKQSVTEIPICCGGRNGGRVLKPSCNLRYENNSFFASSADSFVDNPPAVPAAPALEEAKKKSNTKQTVIIIVVVLVVFVTIFSSICFFFRVKKRRVKLEQDENSEDDSEDVSLVESLQYDFETIRSATDDFSDANKLGRGGFGAVYKGRLLNGQPIAVKRLSENSEQGDREFKNEVMLLAQLQHRNLVRLLGFCLKTDERLLIYEYVPNTSLDHFIFDTNNHEHLDWETRYKIIGGIARGILYLHEDSRVRIIHRDLKTSNILLDEDMNPKIADFGMARLFAIDQTQGDTRTVGGTYGYMAPEYVIHGRFSVKTDVFSFGVLVLEIVSGKKIGSFRYGENEVDLLTYAWRNWREDTIENIIDPVLTASSRIETMRCIHIGLLCVQENVVDRPTVASVVSMLNSQSLALSVPSQPAFYIYHKTGSDILTLTESDQS